MSNTSRKNKINDIPPVYKLIDSAIRTNKPPHVSLNQIVGQCGLSNPNNKVPSSVMSMLRSGSMRLPLNKIIPVADALGINRRTLFISQIRDSIYNLIVKTKVPDVPECIETDDEKTFRKAVEITHDIEYKEFTMTLEALVSLFESPLLTALFEIEEEVGHRIELDSIIIENFKNQLRDQYAL